MLTIDVRKGDIAKVLDTLDSHKQIPYALQLAMNSWLFQTNQHLKNKVDQYLEGGAEKFTKSGFRVRKVKNKRNLYGDLHLSLQHKKAYADRYYLRNIVFGGKVIPPTPKRKKLMQAIPGRVALNQKGNLTKGKFQTLRNNKKKYFYGIPKGNPETENYRGLWKRLGRGKNKKIQMVIALGKESREQQKLFPVQDLAMRRMRRFPIHFARGYKRAVIGARRRRQG